MVLLLFTTNIARASWSSFSSEGQHHISFDVNPGIVLSNSRHPDQLDSDLRSDE